MVHLERKTKSNRFRKLVYAISLFSFCCQTPSKASIDICTFAEMLKPQMARVAQGVHDRLVGEGEHQILNGKQEISDSSYIVGGVTVVIGGLLIQLGKEAPAAIHVFWRLIVTQCQKYRHNRAN